LELRVLGTIELVNADGPIQINAAMQRRLLAALVMDPGQPRSTDALVDAVWGRQPPASAKKLLQVYVSQLRKRLPAPARIVTREPGYALELPLGALDATRFEQLLGEGRAAFAAGNASLATSLLAQAAALWRGEAFSEFRYDDFARDETARLEELRLQCMEERFEAELALGRHEQALPDILTLAAAHASRERLQSLGMLALYRSGRQSEALDLYSAARSRLREDLGLEPGADLRALHQQILQHDPELTLSLSDAAPRARLPFAPNRLIGRRQQLVDLEQLLTADDVRLVVLSGAGGSGKTRLAIEAARLVEQHFANGVAFVALAPVRDPELVVPTISSALGIQEVAGLAPLETLVEGLRGRELLLVLDNAEHVREASHQYVELLKQAPRLTVMVTSRVVLHLTGEHVYPVGPLGDEDGALLFRERAQQAEPSEAAGTEPTVAQIVRRLDGLPLALELAASRMRTLTAESLLAHLDRRLPLLTSGPRDLPARQQTLKATIDWSYELLDPGQQRLLAALSIFAGGWTLKAAVEVGGAELDTLQALVDSNLMGRTGSRYWMLETIREYAAERFNDSGEAPDVARHHAEHFVSLAERAELELEGEHQSEWLERLEAELSNLRSALEWSEKFSSNDVGVRLAGALRTFWFKRGRITEGRRFLASALDAYQSNDTARIKALFGGALLATLQADWAEAKRLSIACNELSRALGEPRFAAISLVTLGRAVLGEGNPESAASTFEAAIAEAREHDDNPTLAMARLNLGYLFLSGGDLARADIELAAAHTEFVGSNDNSGVARSLAARGAVAIHENRMVDADILLCASLRASGMDQESIAWPLQLLGVARSQTDPQKAAVLLAAAQSAREAIDVPLQGIELTLHDQAVAAIRSVLASDDFSAGWSSGRALTMEEALEQALSSS
jgi:predicted ATPase